MSSEGSVIFQSIFLTFFVYLPCLKSQNLNESFRYFSGKFSKPVTENELLKIEFCNYLRFNKSFKNDGF